MVGERRFRIEYKGNLGGHRMRVSIGAAACAQVGASGHRCRESADVRRCWM